MNNSFMPVERPLRILVTNDDGIDAAGIEVLIRIAHKITSEVYVVAPMKNSSGFSHSASFDKAVTFESRGDRAFAVDGTPADCVILATEYFMKDNLPDLILSGINHGLNVGNSVTYSGTIGAALEGAMRGIHSIALSQAYEYEEDRAYGVARSSKISWDVPNQYGESVVRYLIKLLKAEDEAEWALEEGHTERPYIYSVNFPYENCCGIKFSEQGAEGYLQRVKMVGEIKEYQDSKDYQLIASGFPHAAMDIFDVNQGYISISPIKVDMTNYDALDALPRLVDLTELTEVTCLSC